MSTAAPAPAVTLAELRPPGRAAMTAFGALLLRDLAVLRKNLPAFVMRVVMQPALFVFVFTYVFPKIGQGIGGGGRSEVEFASLIVPGVVAIACIFQGVQAVALPLVQEFGFTREIEDRVMAPLPVWGVAVQKIASAALQGLLAAAIVFPLAAVIPTTAVHLHVRWLVLLTVAPLATLLGAAFGLTMGTRVQPNQVSLMFSLVIIPITFLGATYYPWARLTPIPWLKAAVLLNPLVYMSEGLRAALTPQFPHMNLAAIYGALIGYTAFLTWAGINGFRRRVLT